MAKYHQAIFTPRHPEKYIGKGLPYARSSWETAFMTFLDNHPSILQWSSESIRIPYHNPLTGKKTTYVPDFLIIYQDKDGVTHAEIIEIKPAGQAVLENAKGMRNQAAAVVNMAKWASARIFCADKGLTFRVLTEHQLFAGSK
jgi:hypothetical protein